MNKLEGMRILVTGSDGFIGSHLVERLVRDGAEVTAMCIYNSNGSLGWLDPQHSQVSGDFRPVLGDIRDAEFVRGAVEGHDAVLHLAALIAIPYSYVAPRSFVETNVTGTLNVLEASRAHGVTRIINTSTSEVYGTPDSVPIDESHALKGQSPYSASKIGADKLAEAYALSFDLPVATLRPFNTYGPRQSARAVIPTVLTQLLSGAEKLNLGSLEPQRDFTFVSDTVDGYIRMLVADIAPGEVVHLGTGTTVSIGELVQLCMRVVGHQVEIVADAQRMRPAASEVDILLSDPSRAKSILGWVPEVRLEDGLREVATWLDGQTTLVDSSKYQR